MTPRRRRLALIRLLVGALWLSLVAVPTFTPVEAEAGKKKTQKVSKKKSKGAKKAKALKFKKKSKKAPSGPIEARALRIKKNRDCVDGPLSRCRKGDYLIENGEIKVIIQALGRNQFGIGQFGGQIIDADVRRAPGVPENDNFEEWAVAINLENTAHYTDISIVNDGTNGQPAVIRVSGPDDLLDFINASSTVASFGFAIPATADDNDLPMEISTDYTLAIGASYVKVETTLQNTDPGSSYDIFFGEYLNGSGSLEVFQPGYGFGETLVSNQCPAAAPNPCNVIAYGGIGDGSNVSYGYVHEIPGSTGFTTSGVSVPALGVELAFALVGLAPPNFTLEPMGTPGDQLVFTRYFVVGDGTVSSILDTRNEIAGLTVGTLRGTITTPSGGAAAGAEVAVLGNILDGPSSLGSLDLNVVSHTRTDASGGYELTVAPGNYDVVVNIEGHPYQGGGGSPALNPVVIGAAATTNLDVSIPDTGLLQVSVSDGAGNPLPAKASVVGFDPSPDQLNTQSILGLINNTTAVFRDRFEDGLDFGLAQIRFIDPSGISGPMPLEPGDYEVVVSRGTEYSIDSVSVAGLAANSIASVNAKIAPVIDSTGFVSGDFHVHSIDSADSSVTRLDRIVSMLAEGVDFFTPSDHGFRADFQPLVEDNDWDDLVHTATSGEITTFDYGHFNAWPMTIDDSKVNGGSVDHGGAAPAGEDFPSFGNYSLTPDEIIAAADSDPGTNTVQINHFYSHFGLDGGSGLAIDTGEEPPISAVPPAALRLDPSKEDPSEGYFSDAFDALEVWIGDSRGQIFDNFLSQNAGDWFNLLNQGIVRTAIADSDTHRRIITQAGVPRSMIASAEDDPGDLDAETLSATVNAGKVIGTNGPMLRVGLEALTSGSTASLENGASQLVSAADGKVEITVGIQSPAWAEFDSVEFYLNSATTKSTFPGLSGAGPVTVARYAITPDVVQTAGADFTVSSVGVNGAVPGGSRLEATATLTLDGVSNAALSEDTWIVVMVKGSDGVSRPLFPMVPNDLDSDVNADLADLTDGNLDEEGILALAFSNPLFVDVNDGAGGGPDGDYDAPGVQLTP